MPLLHGNPPTHDVIAFCGNVPLTYGLQMLSVDVSVIAQSVAPPPAPCQWTVQTPLLHTIVIGAPLKNPDQCAAEVRVIAAVVPLNNEHVDENVR
jgi:hypothetical protein